MNIDILREKMLNTRRVAEQEAKYNKDPYTVIETLCSLYRGLDDSVRADADRVIIEWVLSQDEGVRFDAIFLIEQFSIIDAVSVLKKLASDLEKSKSPSAPYEVKKIARVLGELETA